MPNSGALPASWITQHPSTRPILSTDRLSDLRLKHLGSVGESPSSHATYTFDGRTFSGANYPINTPPQSSIGLRTPSPSPTSHSGARQSSLAPDFEHLHNAQSLFAQDSSSFAMNQHQGGYLDTQQPMSGGQQYAPHHTAGGNMSQYGAYPSQSSPSVMSSGHQYAPSPSAYNSHYGYGAGMGSPHGSAPSVPPPIGQVTSGHPPLPSRYPPPSLARSNTQFP